MDITVVITSIMVMGVMIGIGAFFASKVPVTAEVKQAMILIVLNIAVPSIVLNGVFNTEVTDQLLNQAILIFFISLAFHLGALLFAWIFTRIAGFRSLFAKKMTILAALGNTGFIGIPLCATIFGPTGGLLAAVFDAGLDLILFSVGVYLLQSGEKFQLRQLKSVINLPLVAVVTGLTAGVTGFQPPAILQQLTALLSGLAAPLAMLYIGMMLYNHFRVAGLKVYRQIWFPLVIRLMVIPAVTLAVVLMTPLDPFLQALVVILSAMPTITLSAILFGRYAGDEETAVVTIAVSTVLSLGTIPLVALAANLFGG
ncbi:AEC family transporter [Alteribacter natronophilus]|uniref:AEC family transporter n=1 Tax=Alteribacter natronophilus TaxID=2583810 RepID=UPI00110E9496|nr:AEC family transporter [Alteribacter natronophilus]TMW72328.1 auxin efflux carrier [Alteribacter natronophilus]